MRAVFRALCMVVPFLPATLSAAEPALPAASAPPAVFVGVVRGDGRLVPLAARAAGSEEWAALSGNDPGRGDLRTVHIRSRALLPSRGWTLHRLGGAPARSMAILGLETVDAYCEQQEVLTTDALPAASGGEKRPALGIATHGLGSVIAVEDVAHRPDDASKQVASLVVQLTQAFEADRAVQPSSRLDAISTEQRARTPVEITQLKRARDGHEDSYYFEAQKAYGRTQTYAQGWVRSSRFRLSLTGVSAGVDGGGESVRPRGEVLGALRYGGIYWVIETLGYEGSSYSLVGPGGEATRVSGGGC